MSLDPRAVMASKYMVELHVDTIVKPDPEDIKPSTSQPEEPKIQIYHNIKNKLLRNKEFHKHKAAAQKEKQERRNKRKQEDEEAENQGIKVEKRKSHTIESKRIIDETTIGDLNSEDNIITQIDINHDEFNNYYKSTYVPKILITFSDKCCKTTRAFGKDLTRILSNAKMFMRQNISIKTLVKEAPGKGFTDILIVNEDRKRPNGLLLIHLPDGPTAHFRLTNVKRSAEICKERKMFTKYTKMRPEIILNHFTTRLGLSVGRMLGTLFHYSPEFKGTRVVTFHNQRDFIFFRHHLYTFDVKKKKVRLCELGPRFTLKLKSLQKGTFDSKHGEYEWIIDGRRHQMETNRRKFFL